MYEAIDGNKAVMRRVFEEMWNQHQPGAATRLFERPEGVERFVRSFLESFPDLMHSIEGMITEDDIVTVKFSARGTHTGKWMDIVATGRAAYYSGVTWASVRGNRIAQHHTWWDKASLMEQLQRHAGDPS